MNCHSASVFIMSSNLSLAAFISKFLIQTLIHSPLYYCLQNLLPFCSPYMKSIHL